MEVLLDVRLADEEDDVNLVQVLDLDDMELGKRDSRGIKEWPVW